MSEDKKPTNAHLKDGIGMVSGADDELILELFRDASTYPVDYMFALLRVGGIEAYAEEPLAKLARRIKEGEASIKDINESEDLWKLLTNLSRLQRQVYYMPFPPFTAKDGSIKESALHMHVTGKVGVRLKELGVAGDEAAEINFMARFLEHYRGALKEFTKENHTIFPINVDRGMFEVFEILADKDGLNGFKVYFSNDSAASFKRTATGTEGFNVIPGNSIDFMVGDSDGLKDAWRMEGKWLYEVGLTERYNDPEEWKPMVYKGKSALIQKEAEKASDDERVQDVFFYMLATGYPVIEFVARTPIMLPDTKTVLEGDINLLLVDAKDSHLANQYVYDGWLRLKDTSPEGVRQGIESIQRAMEGMSFAFDKELRWRLKYGMHNHHRGSAQPNEKDVEFLNALIANSNKEKDLAIDAAVNWYNLGNTTQNTLNAFICFHIAIEGLAAKLAQGELKASVAYGLSKEPKAEKKKRIKAAFDGYYTAYYSTNPEKMIRESADAVGSIRHYLEQALAAVFGKGSQVLDDYFKGSDSIWSVRGKLVHEAYSEWHPEEYAKVQRRRNELEEIAKAFITRVALQVPTSEKRPTWSRMHQMASSMDNPTGAMVVTHIQTMSGKDWRIKPEWIE